MPKPTNDKPAAAAPTLEIPDHLSLLQQFTPPKYLKLGLAGKQGSGKTHTAFLALIGLLKDWGLPLVIGMFDTEGGSAFWQKRCADQGVRLLGHRGRSLDDAVKFTEQCMEAGVPAILYDSVTHIWGECKASYVAQRNQRQRRSDNRLDISDIQAIKDRWQPFADHVINAPAHIVGCGRLGYEWDWEDVDGSGDKTLVRTDRKIKAEGEFGYEFDLLCMMERHAVQAAPKKKGKKKTITTKETTHLLTVLKDRFDILDGDESANPTWQFFKRYANRLDRMRGTAGAVDVSLRTDHGIDDSSRNQWRREQRDRKILYEKITAEVKRCYPGQTAKEKTEKADLAERFFGTRSSTEMEEKLPVEVLQSGWIALYKELRTKFPATAEQEVLTIDLGKVGEVAEETR